MEIEKIIKNTIEDSIKEAVIKVATSYNSPVEGYIKEALSKHQEKITKLLDKAFENLLSGKDFQKEMESVLVKRLSQSILAESGASVQSVISDIQRKNPVLKQEIEVAISKIIKKYQD